MRYKTVVAILFAGTLAFLAPRPTSASWSVSISYFHRELAPFGSWVSSGLVLGSGIRLGPCMGDLGVTDSYIGWACLPPSFEITLAGYAGSPIVVPQNQYVFVPVNNFVGARVSSARVPLRQNAGLLRDAHRVTRFSVSGGIVRASGPPPSFVQSVTGKTLHRANLSSQKLRVTAVAAAGLVSGRRVRIVAPAHESAVAAGRENPANP